jgi:hypothetical protein
MSTTDSRQMKAGARSVLGPERDRLDSWKEIAVYLGREVRTVQRWEKREGLPVHRQFHVKAGTVWAFKHDIDSWFRNRCRALIKPAPRKLYSDQLVNWSSPTLLLAWQTENSHWLWLVVVRDSHRLDSQLGIEAIDGNVDGRKALATNQNPSQRLTHDNS